MSFKVKNSLATVCVEMSLLVAVIIDGIWAANPVLLFHGLADNHKTMQHMASRIQRDFPGTFTHSIELYPDDLSFVSLRAQSVHLIKYIESLNIEGPVTFIGHSQGALTGRHALQNWGNHNITTFISLAGPHVGVSKVPPISGQISSYSNFLNDTIALLCYNEAGQEFSVCNLWNDPTKQKAYKRHNKFLSGSLCQGLGKTKRNDCKEQSDNLKKLEKLVLIGGPQDGTVFPYQSALFGYYDKNWSIVPRVNQTFYQNLGLKRLERDNRIVECIKPNVEHVQFVFDEEVYKDCVKAHIN